MLVLCIIIYGSFVSQFEFKNIKQLQKTGRIITGNRTVLTTTEAGSRAQLLFDSYGTTFVVDNASNTYVWNNSHLLIGPLVDYNVTLDTANGNRGLSLKTGPIRIAWEDNSGETLTYEFRDVVYNPLSPFNILSVVIAGQNFGSIYSPLSNYEEGTWVKSCASYTNFTWDHGRLTLRFSYSSDGLTELSVNIGSSTISILCSKLWRIYDDTVHFCFATSVEYENDDIGSNIEDSGDDIVGKDDFKPGMDVYYKRGNEHNNTAWHINTVEVNGTELHKIHISNSTLSNFPACHLQLLEHPDLTDISIDVETYSKEVEDGLKTEDISTIARPQALLPLHKEFHYWHTCL